MRGPARTRRFSIVAILSLSGFVVLAGAAVKSFSSWNAWGMGSHQRVLLTHGYIQYARFRITVLPVSRATLMLERSHSIGSLPDLPDRSFLGFSYEHDQSRGPIARYEGHYFWVPLWFPLLLLLIAPALWVIARPITGQAFPVITDAGRKRG